ncbi:MAG: bifunctional folylpolyglutamate synthase/dihydrofolate synthase [Oligoflexus sp.]
MKSVAYFESIFKKRVAGIKPGLSRVQAAYAALGKPAADIPSILVGGTNGKGSTAGFLWGMLQRAGIPTGLYSSPHLVHFVERYQMSHAQASDEELVAELEGIQQHLSPELYESLSFFEIATLLALRLFARYQCRFIILEVGLGGRWDATNIVDPLAAIVVSISRDHEQYLGAELAGIAQEKLAIGRAGRPMFWGCSGELLSDAQAVNVFSQTVQELQLKLYVRGREFFRLDDTIEIHLPSIRSVRVAMPERLKMLPRFLQDNFLLALGAYHWLAEKGLRPYFNLPSIEHLLAKVSELSLPRSLSMVARCQQILIQNGQQQKPLLFDVCHNPDGVRVLGESLAAIGLKPPAFVSILADKKIDEMLDQLRKICGPILLFTIDDPRAMRQELLAERHHDLPYFESFAKAWQHALKVWHNQQAPWLVCGSVLAVGQILHVFDIQPFKAANEQI